MIQNKDILNIDKFWKEELIRANTARLFGCSFDEVSGTRNGLPYGLDDQDLIGSHAYSVRRAVECQGKHFVVVRNPWGKSEWTGRWSGGSICLPSIIVLETTGSLSWNVRTVVLST